MSVGKRAKPGGKFLLGADEFGRDILSRVIYGTRVALLVGTVSVTIALVLGILLGSVAGYVGGWVDAATMRAVEVLLAFPYLLLAIAIVSALGSGALNTTIAVGIWGAPPVTRIVRSSVLALRPTSRPPPASPSWSPSSGSTSSATASGTRWTPASAAPDWLPLSGGPARRA